MKIKLPHGLPIVSVVLFYNNKQITLDHVLIDTGCLITIFDTDLMEDIDLLINSTNGKTVRMYGIGGQSELCFQQNINGLSINSYILNDFDIQLGMTKEPYGFDAILGADFFSHFGLNIDFKNLTIF